jgi:LYR motif-containing protein 4
MATHRPLLMYMHLLRAARTFPSSKRASIIDEIKSAYRSNRHESKPDRIEAALQEAQQALDYMNRFRPLTADASRWEYSMKF